MDENQTPVGYLSTVTGLTPLALSGDRPARSDELARSDPAGTFRDLSDNRDLDFMINFIVRRTLHAADAGNLRDGGVHRAQIGGRSEGFKIELIASPG